MSTPEKTRRVSITKRINPCNCGCQGQDPQHKRAYTRVLKNLVQEGGVAYTCHGDRPYDQKAVVSAPWAEEPVEVVHVVWEYTPGEFTPLGWAFVK